MAALNEQEEFEFRLRAEQEAAQAQQPAIPSEEDAFAAEMAKAPWLERQVVGAATAPAKLYYGVKQLFGGELSPEDQQTVRNLTAAEQEAPIGSIAGNIATMVAPGAALAKVPMLAGAGRSLIAPSTLAKSASVGGGYMGLQPTMEQGAAGLEQRALEAGKGALLGGVGFGAAKGLGRMLNPQTAPEVQALMQEGVTPTPGQIIGGGAKKAEEALRSVPVLGDVITSAQRRSLEDFNRAAINRALSPIGQKLEKDAPVGYKAVDDAYQAISKAYDDLLPKLNVKADAPFMQDVKGLKSLAQNLNPAQAKQFENIINNEVMGKFTSSGLMSGETMKQVESKLGGLIRGYQRAADYDQQLLGDALQKAQSALRKMVERGNPKYSGNLARINSAYANLLRVENAASKQGAKEGIFTPAQLESATRSLDASLRKRASAHGKALMQDLGTAGDVVLAQKLPDSGTAARLMYGLGGLGAGAGAAGLAGGVPGIMAAGAGLGASSLLYSRPSQQALASLLTQRPEFARAIGNRLSDLAPYAAIGAVGAAQ